MEKSGPDQGLTLLTERVEAARVEALAYCDQTVSAAVPGLTSHSRWILSGVGSSESHARYLAHLLTRQGVLGAHFASFSELLSADSQSHEGAGLILFSQGLSPNAQAVMRQAKGFERSVLVTAVDVEGLEAAGKVQRAAFLENSLAVGWERMWFPVAEEYTVLLRVIGPMCGYIAAHRLAEWSGLAAPLQRDLLMAAFFEASAWQEQVGAAGSQTLASGLAGIYLTQGWADYMQNLAYKCLEGCLRPLPPLQDAFAFAHGAFQALVGNRQRGESVSDLWWFEGESDRRQGWSDAFLSVCQGAGLSGRCFMVPEKLEPWAIFVLEDFFNRMLLSALAQGDVDQINWPGKGLDGPLYQIGETP